MTLWRLWKIEIWCNWSKSWKTTEDLENIGRRHNIRIRGFPETINKDQLKPAIQTIFNILLKHWAWDQGVHQISESEWKHLLLFTMTIITWNTYVAPSHYKISTHKNNLKNITHNIINAYPPMYFIPKHLYHSKSLVDRRKKLFHNLVVQESLMSLAHQTGYVHHPQQILLNYCSHKLKLW